MANYPIMVSHVRGKTLRESKVKMAHKSKFYKELDDNGRKLR